MISDETLMAYADDEADAATRAQVEAAMREDPETAARVERHRALRELMRGAGGSVLDEPVPERLIAAARGRTSPAGTVVDLSRAKEARTARNTPERRRSWQPAALAASLLLGLGVGYLAWHGSSGTLIRTGSGGGLVAAAALADSLSSQLSDDRSAARVATIGLSFRAKTGEYCRTFALAAASSSGLACHEDNDWKIRVLVQSPAGGSSTNFRTAASELSPAIRAAIDGSIEGEPLDHAGEIAARHAGWAAPAH
jgi:hypothetical protein